MHDNAIDIRPNPPLDKENRQQMDSAKRSAKTENAPVGDGLSKFLNRIAGDIEYLDREKRLQLFRQMIKAHQYLDGNFYGYVDSNCEWRAKEKGVDEVWYSDNQVYPYLRSAMMELSRTQTEILVNAPQGASDELVAAAKFAKMRVDANRDRTYNARLLQTRNAYALLNGITFMYTYMDYGSGRQERIPKIEQNEEAAEGETVRMCVNCTKIVHDPVDLDDENKKPDPKCPSCGSTLMNEISIPSSPDVVIGYEEVSTGHNRWMCPNPVSVLFLMNATCIEETPFIKWKQVMLRSVLEADFPGVKLPSGGIESTELRYIADQQTATPASGTNGGFSGVQTDSASSEIEPVEFHRVWLDYPLYCHIKFDEDMPLGRGKTLKAGQSLGEAFPCGMYFSKVGDLILELWDEDKNRKWTASAYGIRPGSLYGTGSSVVLQDQEVLNDLETLKMANAWHNGVPREFVNPDRITELSADPTVPTTLQPGLGETANIIGNAYGQAPATPLSPEIYALSERKESAIQNKIGALSGSGSGGLADAQKWGDTATAISIKRDLAVGRFSPDLELMADELDRKQAVQFLKNEQEFFTPEQWKRIAGEYGEYGLECFLNCDIDRDLLVTVSPGSYMPRSEAQTQAKLTAFAQLLPVVAQDPELRSYAAEVFNIPETLAQWTSEKTFANKLISRFKALADLFVDQYGDVPDTNIDTPGPALLVAKQVNEYSRMPVDTFLDNHDGMIDALRDWRATDAGRDASNVLTAAVAYRVLLHQTAKTKQMQMLNRSAIEAQRPMQEEAEQQQAAQQQAQEQAQQEAADQNEQQMGAQGLGQIAQYADKEDQRAHEQEMLDKQQAHEKEMKAVEIAAKMGENANAPAAAPSGRQ